MQRLSLRGKLVASFILILLPVLGLLVYGYREAYERRIDTILDNQMQTAQAVAALVDASFDEAITLGWALSNDPVVHTFDPSQLDPHLRRLAPYYPQYFAIAVFNAAGDSVGGSTDAPQPAAQRLRIVADRTYFKQVMATGRPAVSEVLIARGQKPGVVVVTAVPLRDKAGVVIGGVIVSLHLQALSDRVQSVALGPEQHILLVDTTGKAAFYTALHELVWEERNLRDFGPVDAALAGNPAAQKHFTSPLLNDVRLGAFTPSPKYGWVVGVTVREDVALGPVERALRDQLLGFGAIAVLSAGLAFILSRRLVQPVRRLSAHALALGQGDLSQRVEIKTGDELERLGDTFNQMAESLERTLAERKAFGQVAGALVRELTLERVANVVVEQGERVFGSHTLGLFSADPDRGELRLLASRGLSAKTLGEMSVLAFSAPFLAALAARKGQPQEAPDVKALGRELSGARRVAEREGQRSLLAQPLFAKARLVGVLTLAKSAPHHFDQRERELVEAFADLCAAAVENARLYEELRQTLDLREEFISAAAHELKTPVTTIKGYVQAMRKWAPADHEPREWVALDAVNRQCDRITRRVHEMIESVRLRRTSLEQDRIRFDLGDLAAEVVERMRISAELRRLVLKRQVPAPVDADRERIEEVLESLVDNAIKYSHSGGEVEVQVTTQEREAIMAVRDQGIGISLERQEHVFEPFYEPVPSGALGYRGVAALSLYLSKLIIERHKGRIWFESEEGKGSTFYFSLPLV